MIEIIQLRGEIFQYFNNCLSYIFVIGILVWMYQMFIQ